MHKILELVPNGHYNFYSTERAENYVEICESLQNYVELPKHKNYRLWMNLSSDMPADEDAWQVFVEQSQITVWLQDEQDTRSFTIDDFDWDLEDRTGYLWFEVEELDPPTEDELSDARGLLERNGFDVFERF